MLKGGGKDSVDLSLIENNHGSEKDNDTLEI